MPEATQPYIILASASPRRSELLRNAGFEFEVRPAHIDESLRPGEPPRDYAERMAREKARAVHDLFPQELVLGADTVVVVDEQALGKPRDCDDAARMLRMLSGRSHLVITGVCLAGPDAPGKSFEETRSESTEVTFLALDEAEIAAYVATGEPMDKAGAYAIQGRASRWIPKINGCYFNVVGLPVPMVGQMLKLRGYTRI